MASVSRPKAEAIEVLAKRRANMVSYTLLRARVTLEDLKNMRLEEIVELKGVGPETLMNLIIIKELLWKEGI